MNQTPKPIKRDPRIHRLSHDHRQILAFALRIKKGVQRKAALETMYEYIQYFWQAILNPHLQFEEEYLFALFASEDPGIRKALAEHQQIRGLIKIPQEDFTIHHCTALYTLIHDHVRLEERVLFNQFQEQLTELQLEQLKTLLDQQAEFCDNWVEKFWE